MEMLALLSKWALFIIRFIVYRKKGLLLLFQDCLNVAIMWKLKIIFLFYLEHIPSIITLSHFLWSVPVFSMLYRRKTTFMVSSETTIHLVAIFPLICLPTLYKVFDEVITFLNSEFSVVLGLGIVPTLRNKSSTYLYGIVPRIYVRLYHVMDKIYPPLLISSISNFSMLENPLLIVRNYCSYHTLSPWNPYTFWYMALH